MPRILFFFSVASLIGLASFCYGYYSRSHEIWPYDTIQLAKSYGKAFREFGMLGPTNRLVKAKTQSSDLTTVFDPGRVMEGYLIVVGWDQAEGHFTAWLTDRSGNRLHRWTIDYELLDPDGPANGSDAPTGLVALPDGSLILNFDRGDALTRIDRCGRPMWVRNEIFHHEFGSAEDGSLWSWQGAGSAHSQRQTLVNFDPETGETIKSIRLIEDIIAQTGPGSLIFGVRPDYDFIDMTEDPKTEQEKDLFHPNDVDVLHSDLADEFPDFEAGDLLISLRNLHLVAVIDPDTRAVKWWSKGPWSYPHDPDFTKDGKISVYSNKSHIGRSEIVEIDPVSREFSNDYFYGTLNFHASWGGVHQQLPNGNALVVVPSEGRVVEVDPNGNPVVEFNNRVNETTNGVLANAVWVPPSFFESLPRC